MGSGGAGGRAGAAINTIIYLLKKASLFLGRKGDMWAVRAVGMVGSEGRARWVERAWLCWGRCGCWGVRAVGGGRWGRVARVVVLGQQQNRILFLFEEFRGGEGGGGGWRGWSDQQ